MSALNPIPDTWGTRIGAFAELAARGKIILKSDASWRSGQTCGAHVRVEFSDVVGPDRAFDNRNFWSARAEQHYTLQGGGVETYAPVQAGGFTCGVPSVNRLVLNRVRSQRSNFISTDLAPTIAALIGDPRGVQARTLFPSDCIAHNDQISWSLAFLYGLVPPEYH
jgi:hypothetical protein